MAPKTKKKRKKAAQQKYKKAALHSAFKKVTSSLAPELGPILVPSHFSQTAADIFISKYIRRTGVPKTTHEVSFEQSLQRILRQIAGTLKKDNSLSPKQRQRCLNTLKNAITSQKLSFNSPVWFNCGLHQSYGITSSLPYFRYDFKQKKSFIVDNAYEYPPCSACFIQSADDDLQSLYQLLQNEAFLFRFGAGTGSNFSKIRASGEKLSTGGSSSGLMSFLRIFDQSAGAIKSGGTTRRAAKMVLLDADHPEVEEFIQWKKNEEIKAKILVRNGYSDGIEGEAYKSVSGQNSNNSVRLNDQFMEAVSSHNESFLWHTTYRTTKKTAKSVSVQKLWHAIAQSAWECADPGVQFTDHINHWHTCKASGSINGSNPCSEYFFLDDSACNLASLNVLKFANELGQFSIEPFLETISESITAMDAIVSLSSYPTKIIATNSAQFRPLGLGLANLGSYFMSFGIPYDSPKARAIASILSSLLTAQAYLTSTVLAERMGPFVGYKKNKVHMLRVIEEHRHFSQFADLKNTHGITDNSQLDSQWLAAMKKAQALWDQCFLRGKKYGFRNAQVTVMAPTGTIGLLMDCDTMGIEPEYSLMRTKFLVGGGEISSLSGCFLRALKFLRYSEQDIVRIEKHIQQNESIESCTVIKDSHRSIFHCAMPLKNDKSCLSPEAHLLMLAAIQPFISGGISKTINLPKEATVDTIKNIYLKAWQLGIKSVSVYRDQSKASQPLAATKLQPQCPQCQHPMLLIGSCYQCEHCGYSNSCSI